MSHVPHYIFYIVISAVLPIIVITTFQIEPAVMLLLIVSFMGAILTIPRSKKEFETIGFERVFRAYRTLRILRESWKWISILVLSLFLIQIIWVLGVDSNYIRNMQGVNMIPVIATVASFSYMVNYSAYTAWEKNYEFRIFMSREHCKIASMVQDRLERGNHLLSCLRWYERYVKSALNYRLAIIDEVFSKYLTQSNYEQEQSISQFYKAFVSGDALEPLNLLKTFSGQTDGTKILVREDFLSRWKWTIPLISALIAFVGTLITVLATMFTKPI
jgi:hypothetical protein